jgi:hypothetical protein
MGNTPRMSFQAMTQVLTWRETNAHAPIVVSLSFRAWPRRLTGWWRSGRCKKRSIIASRAALKVQKMRNRAEPSPFREDLAKTCIETCPNCARQTELSFREHRPSTIRAKTSTASSAWDTPDVNYSMSPLAIGSNISVVYLMRPDKTWEILESRYCN